MRFRRSALLAVWGAITAMAACGGRTSDSGFEQASGGVGGNGAVGGTSGGVGGAVPGIGGSGAFGGSWSVGGTVASGGNGAVAGAAAVGGTIAVGGMTAVGGSAAVGGSSLGGVGGALGNCCSAHDSPGCNSAPVQACVCRADDYCCNVGWDQLCAAHVESFGCGTCSGVGGSAGTAGTSGDPVAQCLDNAVTACQQCICKNCLKQLLDCTSDFGCLSIAECMDKTGCSGVDCYRSRTCRAVIDRFGGLNGRSMQRVLNLAVCAFQGVCDCG